MYLLNKFYLISLAILCTSVPNFVHAGGAVPGGGESSEIEFKAIGQGLAKLLKGSYGKHFPSVSPANFENAVQSTKVVITSEVLEIDGNVKDAKNYPSENKIEVNRTRWFNARPVAKVLLVFHEYLEFLGLENAENSISSKLIGVLGETEIIKLAAAAAPIVDYKCKLSFLNPDNANLSTQCGPEFLLTTQHIFRKLNEESNIFMPSNAHYDHACGGIVAGLDNGNIFNANFEARLIKLEPGKAEDWGHRSPQQYTYFMANIYAAPTDFVLELTIDHGFEMFKKTRRTYILQCINHEE